LRWNEFGVRKPIIRTLFWNVSKIKHI
jgi:hypothetical protein